MVLVPTLNTAVTTVLYARQTYCIRAGNLIILYPHQKRDLHVGTVVVGYVGTETCTESKPVSYYIWR